MPHPPSRRRSRHAEVMKNLFRHPLSRLSAAYGPVLVSMHYLAWTWGRLALGHWPRPSIDDPKDIPGLWLPHFLILIFVLLLPFAALFPLARAVAAAAGVSRQPGKIGPLIEAAVSTTLLLGSLCFLRWDPHQVASWFAD